MTLGAALITPSYVTVVTDRRFSSRSSSPQDECEKAFLLITADARVSLSFAGLATVGGFSTHEFLMNQVIRVAYPDYSVDGICKRLCVGLTQEFQTNPHIRGRSPSEKRLTIMIAGFFYTELALPIYGVISNWEDPISNTSSEEAKADFKIYQYFLGEGPVTVIIGNRDSLKPFPLDMALLRRDALRIGPDAATNRLASTIRRAAGHRSSAGTIGLQLTSLILPADPNQGVKTDHHTAKAQYFSDIAAIAWALPDKLGFQREMRMVYQNPSGMPPMIVPKVGRNKECPCGSRKRYRDCHGRKGQPKVTVVPELPETFGDGMKTRVKFQAEDRDMVVVFPDQSASS